ncbi:MAG: hypothetical protein ACOYJW_00955 [Candidatus Omnitrophota bacterium]
MEINFFSVVGNGIFVALGIPTKRHEIAVVVIPAEESIEMVEYFRFQFLAGSGRRGPFAKFEILLSFWRRVILFGKIAFRIERFLAEIFFDLRGHFSQLLGKPGFLGQSPACKLLGHAVEQILLDKFLDDIALLIHDPINSEIKLSAVELKQFSQKDLKFFSRICHSLYLPLVYDDS